MRHSAPTSVDHQLGTPTQCLVLRPVAGEPLADVLHACHARCARKPDHYQRRAGNDFSTLYAPLIRDGRMEKYYWNPTREDRVGVCMGIFQHDGVDRKVRFSI